MKSRIHPHAYVFSLFGRYILPRDEVIWVGSLIKALGALGFQEGAVRALVSRMQRKGLLKSRRVGRKSYYKLTDSGLREVRFGGAQAYAASRDEWDGRWTLVTYSIPERYRKQRDTLRTLLSALGYGSLTPGTWVSPRIFSPNLESKCHDLKVWLFMEVFRADHIGPTDIKDLVRQAWPQLPSLSERYQAFTAEYELILQECESNSLDERTCFAIDLHCLIQFITITLRDPNLPLSILPDEWPRRAAQGLFERLSHALEGPAKHYFESIYEPLELRA
jgi:phenylacetic acid degradation operon negative regulatory protein